MPYFLILPDKMPTLGVTFYSGWALPLQNQISFSVTNSQGRYVQQKTKRHRDTD